MQAGSVTREQEAILATLNTEPTEPLPGDGVCPTRAEFFSFATASYNYWNSQPVVSDAASQNFDFGRHFLELIKGVPAFPFNTHQRLFWVDGEWLHLKCRSEWTTTTTAECDVKVKNLSHHMRLGLSTPITYGYQQKIQHQAMPSPFGFSPHMSFLVRFWCYILSCRWVELLARAGEDAQLWQSRRSDATDLWKAVVVGEWHAMVVRGDQKYYAPWSWAKSGSTSFDDLLEANPDSTMAVDALEVFCTNPGLDQESILALCAVMLLSQSPDREIELPMYTLPTTAADKAPFHRNIHPYVDKCITLSCTEESIDSILGSPFLDPGVPCNLVGASLLGARQVLSGSEGMGILQDFMIQRKPAIAPFWLAAIWCGRAQRTLDNALLGYSPVNLPVSSWTGTTQSFIQYRYTCTATHGTILRANEYRLAYLTDPDAFLPQTPYPPFGFTKVVNLGLNIRTHLDHCHSLRSYRMFWVTEASEDILAQSLQLQARSVILRPATARSSAKPNLFQEEQVYFLPELSVLGLTSKRFLDDGDYASENATINIFNWHKETEEGGVWLDMGNASETRKLHLHPWIRRESSEYESDTSDASDPGTCTDKSFDGEKVEIWLNSIAFDFPVEDSSAPGEIVEPL